MWKKEVLIVILSFGSMLHAGTNGPFLNASYYAMSLEVNKPINVLVLASGYNLLAAGCIGPFVAAFGRKFGKRPVFLVSALFDIVGTATGGPSTNISLRLGSYRVFQPLPSNLLSLRRSETSTLSTSEANAFLLSISSSMLRPVWLL